MYWRWYVFPQTISYQDLLGLLIRHVLNVSFFRNTDQFEKNGTLLGSFEIDILGNNRIDQIIVDYAFFNKLLVKHSAEHF